MGSLRRLLSPAFLPSVNYVYGWWGDRRKRGQIYLQFGILTENLYEGSSKNLSYFRLNRLLAVFSILHLATPIIH